MVHLSQIPAQESLPPVLVYPQEELRKLTKNPAEVTILNMVKERQLGREHTLEQDKSQIV